MVRSMQTAIERDFAVNYYLWALDQWKHEIGRKFPFLKAARDAKLEEADTILQILEPLSDDQARQVTSALLKSTQPETARILGEHLLPEDNLLLDQLNEKRRDIATKKQFFSALKGKSKNPTRARKRKLILDEVKKALEPVLGKLRKDSGSYYIDTPMGDWTLRTSVDVNGQWDLAYSHDIPLGPEVWRLLTRNVSALSWLGINQTFWADLSTENIPAAANFMLFATRRFLDAAPNLLPKRAEA